MRLIAVFDTNVLFSGVAWKGRPFECLELARAGVVQAATCRELLDELHEKLQAKLSFSAEESLHTLVELLTFLPVVPITGEFRAVSADPDDDKVLECALASGATHVVTGDRRHLLPMKSFRQVPIISPAEFVDLAVVR